MLFYFVALFTAAVIVILNNRRSESNRWAALFLFSASIGGLSEVLIDNGLFIITDLLQFLNYTFTPYAVFVFCLLYASVLDHNRMRKN